MPLLIDTYNVLHVAGVLPPELAGIDTAGLVDLLQTSRYRRKRIILVCDGTVPPGGLAGRQGPQGSIDIQYSGPDRTADDAIAHLINLSTEPRRLTVVSSDRRHVLAAARRRRCRTLTSEQFLAQLAADHRAGGRTPTAPAQPVTPLTRGEVRTWISEFGLDEEDLRPASIPEVISEPPVEPSDEDERPDEVERPSPDLAEDPGDSAEEQPSSPPVLIPRSVLEEAHAMITEHEQERKEQEAARRRDIQSSDHRAGAPDSDQAGSKEAPPAAGGDPVKHWAHYLTPEVIAEAERSATEFEADGRSLESPRKPSPDGTKPDATEEEQALQIRRMRPGSDVMPPDIIAEAEAMWREEDRDGRGETG